MSCWWPKKDPCGAMHCLQGASVACGWLAIAQPPGCASSSHRHGDIRLVDFDSSPIFWPGLSILCDLCQQCSRQHHDTPNSPSPFPPTTSPADSETTTRDSPPPPRATRNDDAYALTGRSEQTQIPHQPILAAPSPRITRLVRYLHALFYWNLACSCDADTAQVH